MIISEEGPSVEDFNPDHAINTWYGKKMRRFGGETSHKYPAKRARTNSGTINLARVTLSDLENDKKSDDNYTSVYYFFVHNFFNVLLSTIFFLFPTVHVFIFFIFFLFNFHH